MSLEPKDPYFRILGPVKESPFAETPQRKANRIKAQDLKARRLEAQHFEAKRRLDEKLRAIGEQNPSPMGLPPTKWDTVIVVGGIAWVVLSIILETKHLFPTKDHLVWFFFAPFVLLAVFSAGKLVVNRVKVLGRISQPAVSASITILRGCIATRIVEARKRKLRKRVRAARLEHMAKHPELFTQEEIDKEIHDQATHTGA